MILLIEDILQILSVAINNIHSISYWIPIYLQFVLNETLDYVNIVPWIWLKMNIISD